MSNRGCLPNHYFSDTELHSRSPEHFAFTHPEHLFALIAHSSAGDVASTSGTGILCSRAWIRMYVARLLEEHE